MSVVSPSWAKLRQVVVATNTHEDDIAAIREAFGLGPGFGDPELKEMSLADVTMPVSAERYLEFVSPTDTDTSVAKWLSKIGGRGGYVLSVQHPDPEGVRARCQERGIRIPVDQEAFGKTILQLHPKDMGLVLEIDGMEVATEWFWDDIDPGPEPGAGVVEILGIDVPVDDPISMNALWHEILDIGKPVKGDEADLGGAFVRFLPGGPSPAWTIYLRRSATAASVSSPHMAGIKFQLV